MDELYDKAWKLSRVISLLQKILEIHGDLPVISSGEMDYPFSIDSYVRYLFGTVIGCPAFEYFLN